MRGAGAFLLAAALALPAGAEPTAAHRERRPDLFHPETGLRIARQRAPTPDDVPGASVVHAAGVTALVAEGAVLLDVGAALRSHFDELDGTWLVPEEHPTLPGATWLPETGRGTLSPEMDRYLADHLERLTGGDRTRPVVVFCVADCWMSWNAAQRISALGYARVHWFPDGVDGWRDAGGETVPATPPPVSLPED